ASAAVSDRARPMTSCPAARSSGMMYEPEWPVPPVTKTRMLLLGRRDVPKEGEVRGVRSGGKVDAEGEVEVPHAMAGQADHQYARAFPPARPLQAAGAQR